jgi:DNA-binding NarL/FixJ family response regulator
MGDLINELTTRETEVLAMLADGLSNRAIARNLWLSQRTVEAHTRTILMKLNVCCDNEVNHRVLAARAFWESQTRPRVDAVAA